MSKDFGGATEINTDFAVGAIKVIRSFGIGEDGKLLPITSSGSGRAWVEGENTATCNAFSDHVAPEDGCRCGYYGYSSPAWIETQYQSYENIQAVIECYGTVKVGEKGVRSQKARIAAVALRGVPENVVELIRANYPSIRIYDSRKAMLTENPLTELDSYLTPPNTTSQAARRVAVASAPWLAALTCIPYATGHLPSWSLLVPWTILTGVPWRRALSVLSPTPRVYTWLNALTGAIMAVTLLFAAIFSWPSMRWLAAIYITVSTLTAGFCLWRFIRPAAPGLRLGLKGFQGALAGALESDVYMNSVRGPLPTPVDLRVFPDRLNPTRVGHAIMTRFPTTSGDIVFAQPIITSQYTYALLSSYAIELAAGLAASATAGVADDVLVVVVSGEDDIVAVAMPPQIVSASRQGRVIQTSIQQAFSAFHFPDGLWCPPQLRPNYLQRASDPQVHAGGPVAVTVCAATEVTRLSESDPNPSVRNALSGALGQLEASAFRTTQALIAKVGLQPAVTPRIPMLTATPTVSDRVTGWRTVLQYAAQHVDAEGLSSIYRRSLSRIGPRASCAIPKQSVRSFSAKEAKTWTEGGQANFRIDTFRVVHQLIVDLHPDTFNLKGVTPIPLRGVDPDEFAVAAADERTQSGALIRLVLPREWGATEEEHPASLDRAQEADHPEE